MAYYNPSHTVIWVIIAEVFIQALMWLCWLYRFYSRPPKDTFTIRVGLSSLTLGTGAIETFLVFGLQEAFGGKTPAFWIGIGCTVSTCLSATCMALITIVWAEQLFKPLVDPEDCLRNQTDPELWSLTAFAAWVVTIVAVGLAAANISLIALVSAATGGTLLQLACSMWLREVHGTIIRSGLGITFAVILVMVIVLLGDMIYKGRNQPMLNIIPLSLWATQQVVMIGQALVIDSETFLSSIMGILQSTLKLYSPRTRNANSREFPSPLQESQTGQDISSSLYHAQNSIRLNKSTSCTLPPSNPRIDINTMQARNLEMQVGFTGGSKIIVKQPEHEILQHDLEGHIHISVSNNKYALDGLEEFAARLPWYQLRKGTFPLADFTKYLAGIYHDQMTPSPLISVFQEHAQYFYETLKLEIENQDAQVGFTTYPWDQYHFWSRLVSLQHSSVFVRVNHEGLITTRGSEVEATIFDFDAKYDRVLIYFAAGSEILPPVQIPWHGISDITRYGVYLLAQDN